MMLPSASSGEIGSVSGAGACVPPPALFIAAVALDPSAASVPSSLRAADNPNPESSCCVCVDNPSSFMVSSRGDSLVRMKAPHPARMEASNLLFWVVFVAMSLSWCKSKSSEPSTEAQER